MRNKKFDFRTAFIDLLINAFVGILYIFMITVTMMNPPKKNEDGVKKYAEYIIETNWDPERDCDVDIWVKDPANRTVFYAHREAGMMAIERDDRGLWGDTFNEVTNSLTGQKTRVEYKLNRELWTLRGIEPGKFLVNVHLFNCRQNGISLNPGQPTTLDVEVELTKINPSVVLKEKTIVTFHKNWEELNAFVFTITPENEVKDIKQEFHKLVKDDRTNGASMYGGGIGQ